MYAQQVEGTEDESLWTAYSQDFRADTDDFREAALRLQERWRAAPESVDTAVVESIWASHSSDRSPRFLMELIKVDQAERIKAGMDADLDRYLKAFPSLAGDDARIVSLAYAEFCAHEDLGKAISVDSFCRKYSDWNVSIRRQLAMHEMLSIPSNELHGHEVARHFPKVGERVEHFELIRELGRGGAARVFLAHDLSLGRRCVALKISGDSSTEPEILARLDHDNIVPVLSVHDAQDGLRLICMPYRGDVTLDRVFAKLFAENRKAPATAKEFLDAIDRKSGASADSVQVDGPEGGWIDFPNRGDLAQAVAWIGWKLAGALAHAHASAVFHRDIKPANILISPKSGPQLLDFNMARDPEAVQTVEDRIRGGTLPYMAPEQLAAFLDASLWSEIREPADIYSLGLVLQEFLRGKRVEVPLSGNVPVKSQVRALLRQRDLSWVSLRTQNASVPYALDAIIAKATAFRLVDRYRSAQDLAEDLHRFLTYRPLKFAVNPSRRERLTNMVRPRSRPTVSLVALAASIGLFLNFSTDGPSMPVIPGVEAAVVSAFLDKDMPAALALLNRSSTTAPPNASRDLLHLIAWIEARPDDVQGSERLKALVLKPDLERAVSQVQGVVGENRHLDFLLIYRDYCRLAGDANNNPPGNLEWQNLERRFLAMIEKWPNDIRPYGFAAHMASMRSDHVTAIHQAKKGLALLDKTPALADSRIREELLSRLVNDSYSLGFRHLKDDDLQSAETEFRNCLDTIVQSRKLATGGNFAHVPDGFLDLFEVQSHIGIGDCLFGTPQHSQAAFHFESASELLKRNAGKTAVKPSLAGLEEGLRRRFEAFENRDPSSGLVRPTLD